MSESRISSRTGLENRRVDSKYTRPILQSFRKILQLARLSLARAAGRTVEGDPDMFALTLRLGVNRESESPATGGLRRVRLATLGGD